MLGVVLQLLTILFSVLAVIVVLIAGSIIAGSEGLEIGARVDSPYTVVFGTLEGDALGTDRYLAVNDDRIVTRGNWPTGEEARQLRATPDVTVDVTVTREDQDTRLVSVAVLLLGFAIAWLALRILRRIVDGAVRGDPFDAANPRRFRALGALAVGAFGVFDIGSRIIDRTLDSDVEVSVSAPPPGWVAVVVIALVLATLGEIFREGAQLDEISGRRAP